MLEFSISAVMGLSVSAAIGLAGAASAATVSSMAGSSDGTWTDAAAGFEGRDLSGPAAEIGAAGFGMDGALAPVEAGDGLVSELARPDAALDPAAELPAAGPAPHDRAEERLRRRGGVRLSLEAGVIYDDNIFLSAREEVEDFLYVISPSIRLGLGDLDAGSDSALYLNYDPQAVFFQDNSDENAVDHSLEAGFRYAARKLSAAVTASMEDLHGSNIIIGSRTERRIYRAAATLTYGWTGRTSLEADLLFEHSDYNEFLDITEWRAEAFALYQLTGKTVLGVGAGVGQIHIDGGQNQDYFRALATVRSDVTGKISLHATGGADFRDYGSESEVTPVFGVGASYEPSHGTLVTLNAERDISASPLSDESSYVRTGAALGVDQRFGSRFRLGLAGGIENFDYRQSENAAVAERDDTACFVRPSLRYDFREDLHGELYYLRRENESNDEDSAFSSNQVGLALGIDF